MIFFYRKRARSVSPVPSQDMADNRDSRGSSFGWPQGADAAAGGAVPGRSATFTDRRMKPNAVLYPNGPRDSSVSLQDNEDYSRPVLRVCEPLSSLLIFETPTNIIRSSPTPIKNRKL